VKRSKYFSSRGKTLSIAPLLGGRKNSSRAGPDRGKG
jgi:hypothetical protein